MHCVWKIAIPCSEPGPPLWPPVGATACCWPGAGGAWEVATLTQIVMVIKNASAMIKIECRFILDSSVTIETLQHIKSHGVCSRGLQSAFGFAKLLHSGASERGLKARDYILVLAHRSSPIHCSLFNCHSV